MRKALIFLLTVALLLGGVSLAHGGTCAIFKTWATGDTLTAGDLTSSFTTVGQTNMTLSCLSGDSATIAGMQVTQDPFPAGVESLAVTALDELERIRFVLKQVLGTSQWYKYTDPFVLGPAAPTGSNLAGAALTLQGGPGTGTGAGGNLVFKLAYPGVAGSTANAETTVLTALATNNQASGTAALWSLAATVNQSGTAGYTGLQLNITETATGSGTNNLLDLQLGGVSKFSVDRTGALVMKGALTLPTAVANPAQTPSLFLSTATTFRFVGATGGYEWYNTAITQLRMALTDAGIFLLNTTITSGAVGGNVVTPNSVGLQGVNAAGTATLNLIYLDAANAAFIGSNAVDIRWGKALVTLGGGVAPTLGTIGGAGPATAAQNSWMRVLDSTGTAFWVPAWK